MEVGIEAARWVVGKALGPAAGGVLEAWAASSELGTNIRDLRMELLYAQGMLNNARGGGGGGREDTHHNPALQELMQELRDLAYSADDALDEVDYFRIQDELDGTYHAADEHAGGCLRNHALNARHTVRGIGKMLGLSSSSSRSARRGGNEEPSEGTGVVSCGAWPCRGHGSPDDGEQEDEASRCMPCGRATRPQPTQPRLLLPTNQGGQEEQVPKGCMQKIASAASNTINILGKRLPCPCNSVSLPAQNDANSNMASNGRRFLCCGRPNSNRTPRTEHSVKVPKLKFDRVQMSKKIKEITEQLKPVCAKVSTILNLELLDSNRSIAQCIATSLDTILSKKQGRIPMPTHSGARNRPVTTAELIEPKIYGRDGEISNITYDITEGDYCDKDLTVLPIVGPGGIGKTTLTQAIYKELQHHFAEKIWVCVSTTFSVYKLTQEIADNMKGDKKDNPEKVIEEKLKSKKFLLVLDDMWSCSDDDWGRFLVPFTKGQTKGSIVLVTTRFPAVAQMVKTTKNWIDLKSIDSEAFKDLFLAYVFGDKNSSSDHSGLLNIGFKIVEKLKGSPLAAKTVGRLLKKNLDFDHWNRILESKEWESENGENDIMPALKLSYDYLPFHLQHCFSYCALFPEDYKFVAEELIHLWIGLDVLHSHEKTRRIEDIGQNHLTELVNSGFFRKEEEDGELTCYVIHDLLHELVLKISSHECLSINSPNAGSTQIPPSIRYLSINIDDTSVKDKITFDTCQKGLSTLIKRLKVGSLRSFMLFGQYQGSFVKTVAGLLKEAKALRVIFLSNANSSFEDLLHNYPYCVHLRYLRIQYYNKNLPGIISRFYHLRVLDLRICYGMSYSSTKDMCDLVKLRHFVVPHSNMHSSIYEVGKLASLQELRKFVVKKESRGFELNQIGDLTELCGSLHIGGLEKIELMEEADGAKLIQKTHLHELILHWDSGCSNKNPTREENVLESLKPSSNILKLCIRGQCGMACPSWLGANLSVPNLEFLQLDDVSWKTLPPIGELWLVDEQGKEYKSYIPSQSFNNLKQLELIKIPKLKKWIGNSPCELFSHLKVLIIRNCPELKELPFTHHTGCEPGHEDHMTWFPKLELIEIVDCPNLSSLPCIPWSSAMCSVRIKQVGSTLECLNLKKNYKSEYHMEIKGKDALDSSFWRVLSFHNLSKLESLKVTRCPPLSLDNLQMLSSLKTLEISDISNAFLVPEGNGQVGYQFPVKSIIIKQTCATGETLTHLLSYFTELHDVEIGGCDMLTGLGVVDQRKKTGALELLVTSSVIEVEKEEAQIIQQEEQQYDTSGEEEIAAAASTSEGLLLLPPQLHNLKIRKCPNLVLYTHSLNDDKDSGQTQGGGGGLQGLCSLRSLVIDDCPRFLSSYSSPSSSSCSPFPSSLEDLTLENVDGTEIETTLPLSNLTSLTNLSVERCGNLRGEGLRHLVTRGRLTKLFLEKTPIFLAGCEIPLPCEQEFQSSSSKLQELWTDDVAGVLAPPICTLLSSSLTELGFDGDKVVERFTKKQEDALQLLTSLEEIRFWSCDKLLCLPEGLHGLPKLKRLGLYKCPAIRSLPKDGLPSSLQELEIDDCPAFQSLPKDCLPTSLQKLEIESCPAIRSLPKDCLPSSLQILKISNCPAIRSLPKVNDLPNSLQELEVRYSESKELRRQCRKLIGTIPVVYA